MRGAGGGAHCAVPLLQGSTVVSVVQRRKEAIQSDYDSLFGQLFVEYPALFKKEDYTFEQFRWALCTVWSRAFVFRCVGISA